MPNQGSPSTPDYAPEDEIIHASDSPMGTTFIFRRGDGSVHRGTARYVGSADTGHWAYVGGARIDFAVGEA